MRSAALVIAVALAALVATARADNKDEARKHVEAADTSYQLGDFPKALDEYSKAYELYRAPALLFNIGQCHRQLQHYDKALFFYEGFLRDSPADAPNRAMVEGLASDMRAAIAKQQADQAAQAQADREARDRAAAAAAADAQRREEAEARRRADEDRQVADARRAQAERDRRDHDDHVYNKWWFWPAVGGAALALGGTAYFATRTTTVEPSGTLGGLNRQ